jgi:hypothetical protein
MMRLFTLTFTPVLLVGLAYLVSQPNLRGHVWSGDNSTAADENPATRKAGRPPADRAKLTLLAACQKKREALVQRLGTGFASIVHVPYVLVGDVSATELERKFRETVAPADRALSVTYFDTPPSEPICMVLLSGDEAYQSSARLLDGQNRAAFAGYYERGDRRIVLNLLTGEGTISHELTHALAHFDFPDMPEWFDEGLASLHEEARFSDDGLRLIGISNWRGRYLAAALQRRALRPLASLIGESRVRTDQQAIDYAHARYLCLFLQERNLLAPFYRKFRAAGVSDPTGARTLCGLFRTNELASIDEEFRAWALALIAGAPTRFAPSTPDVK